MISSKRRSVRLSKIILSSSVGDGGGVLIEVVVVVSAVISAVVVMGVRVVRLWGTALFSMVLVLSATGYFGFSARFGGALSFFEGSVLLLLSWSHKG